MTTMEHICCSYKSRYKDTCPQGASSLVERLRSAHWRTERDYCLGDVLRIREQEAGEGQLFPLSATCDVTAARASTDELLTAREAS